MNLSIVTQSIRISKKKFIPISYYEYFIDYYAEGNDTVFDQVARAFKLLFDRIGDEKKIKINF